MSIASAPTGSAESTPTSPVFRVGDHAGIKPLVALKPPSATRLRWLVWWLVPYQSITSWKSCQMTWKRTKGRMHQNSKSRAATSLSSCTERKVTSCPYGRRNHPNLLRHWHLGSAAKWPRPGPPTTIHHASGISGSSHSFIEVSRVKVLVGHQSCSSRFHNRIPKGKERGEREREREGKLFQTVSDQDAWDKIRAVPFWLRMSAHISFASAAQQARNILQPRYLITSYYVFPLPLLQSPFRGCSKAPLEDIRGMSHETKPILQGG